MFFTFSTVLLISSALAHMRILKPDVKFSDLGQQFHFSTLCELAKYPPGPPETMGPAINKAMKEAGFETVKDLADKCGKPCGLTDKTFLVDPPADGIVVIDDHNINPPHPGPSEIWFDGKKVLYNDGSNYTKENPQHNTKVDFSVCTKDACELRFVMAASHVFPTEIYDNCVMVRGTGKGGKSSSDDKKDDKRDDKKKDSGDDSAASDESDDKKKDSDVKGKDDKGKDDKGKDDKGKDDKGKDDKEDKGNDEKDKKKSKRNFYF